jgi:hypothetical protein
MKIKLLLLAGVCILTTACQNKKNDSHKSVESIKSENHFNLPDSLSTRRISFVLDLKRSVAESAWPDFGKKRSEGTLIYFDASKSEVFFPDSSVVKTLEDYDVYSDDYLLTERTDSIPYHMEVMISFDSADASQFFYEHPVEQYSSVEEIGNYIPSVESTEMWATMVVHEMFHHYQYNNENYKEYGKSEIGILSFNIKNLISICQEDEEFLAMIQKENDYLMKAISEDNKGIRDSLISKYLNERQIRIQKYSIEHPNLERVENYYVLQEGSARYLEYQTMFILNDFAKDSDSPVVLDDPMFKSYSEFEEIDLKNPAFSYLTYAAPTDYHYTIGFNIMRLLDELKIEYKTPVLNNPEKGLHQYLEDYIDTLPNKT